jgi:hypothetical protein
MSAETSDRRGSERFPIVRDVRYKLPSIRREAEVGTGKTINMSSSGVLFSTQDHPMNAGKRLEVSVSWPFQLDQKCGLKLVVRGRVVRCKRTTVAIEIERYEFRTVGSEGGLGMLLPLGQPSTRPDAR